MRYCFLILILLVGHANAQIPTPSENDNSTYFSQGLGSAGIIQELALSGTDADQISSWMDQLWLDGGDLHLWNKSLEQPSLWVGYKYGQVGIIDSLLSMGTALDEQKYIDYAELSYSSLKDHAAENGTLHYWAYTFLPSEPAAGIATTGLGFGNAAVLDIALKLYRATENMSYLADAETTAQWIVQNTDVEYPGIIPWYNVQGFTTIYYTGVETGIAGIFPLFRELATLTGNTTYEDVALKQVQFLMDIQNGDGSWSSQVGADQISTGYLDGVAGIVKSLYQNGADVEGVNESVLRGAEFLISQFDKRFGFEYSPGSKTYYSGFARGQLGIIYALDYVFSLLNEESVTVLESSLEVLRGKYIVEDGANLLLYRSHDDKEIVDLSLWEGLAGLLFLDRHLRHFNLELSKDKIQSTFLMYENSGHWPRQVISQVSSMNRFVPLDPWFLFSVVILVISRSKCNRLNMSG